MPTILLRWISAFCLLGLTGFSGRLPSQPVNTPTPLQETLPPPRLLLRLKPETNLLPSTLAAEQLLAAYGLQIRAYLPQIQVWVLETSPDALPHVLASLQDDPRCLWVEPDGILTISDVVPDDPYYLPQQANLRLIGLPWAWIFSTGSPNWPVAVIDTGIDLDHPDLQSKVWVNLAEIPSNGIDDDHNGYIDDVNGWNFVNDTNSPQDDQSHGSHVSGILAAHTNNGVGIAGIAWQTPVMALKALDNTGHGNASDVAEAILYAADNGARILNLSFGDDLEYSAIHDAIVYARSQGCLLAAAAGNTAGPVEYPAAQPGVLAVAATDNNDLPTSFSNRGPQIAVAAPGVNIYSASKNGSYFLASGTSASTPQVSGLAALIWNLHPEWSADQVTQVITSTAKDVWSPGRDNLTGWGRIDAQAAVFASLGHVYLPYIEAYRIYEVYLPLVTR
jgi:subtilisin family serine protease